MHGFQCCDEWDIRIPLLLVLWYSILDILCFMFPTFFVKTVVTTVIDWGYVTLIDYSAWMQLVMCLLNIKLERFAVSVWINHTIDTWKYRCTVQLIALHSTNQILKPTHQFLVWNIYNSIIDVWCSLCLMITLITLFKLVIMIKIYTVDVLNSSLYMVGITSS